MAALKKKTQKHTKKKKKVQRAAEICVYFEKAKLRRKAKKVESSLTERKQDKEETGQDKNEKSGEFTEIIII